jgi:hypothetical protein
LPVEISLYLQASNKTPANARDVIVKRIVEIIRKEIHFWNPQRSRKSPTPLKFQEFVVLFR